MIEKIISNRKFAKVSNQSLQKLLDTQELVNTQQVVKRSVAVVMEYLSLQFKEYHKSDLNDNHRSFFALIRCKLGPNVKTSTLNSYKYEISAVVLKIILDG